jgi:hypothetical protein
MARTFWYILQGRRAARPGPHIGTKRPGSEPVKLRGWRTPESHSETNSSAAAAAAAAVTMTVAAGEPAGGPGLPAPGHPVTTVTAGVSANGRTARSGPVNAA